MWLGGPHIYINLSILIGPRLHMYLKETNKDYFYRFLQRYIQIASDRGQRGDFAIFGQSLPS